MGGSYGRVLRAGGRVLWAGGRVEWAGLCVESLQKVQRVSADCKRIGLKGFIEFGSFAPWLSTLRCDYTSKNGSDGGTSTR